MLWVFKQQNNIIETSRKIYSACGQGVLTDQQIWNWFTKICSGETSLEDEPSIEHSLDFDDEALKQSMIKYLGINKGVKYITI